MKKIITTGCLLLTLSSLSAKQLTPSQALQRAGRAEASVMSKLSGHASQSPVAQIKSKTNPDFTALYVFDTDPGYVVVSADDCAAPVLGYSDKATVESSALPPQLTYWLDFYASQIEWAAKNNVTYSGARAAATDMTAIAPLVKTQWNQESPYNGDCPEFDGERSVTGCVATAMAQMMYFHQWPQGACQGGTVSYESEYSTEYVKQISYNFDDVTFDWADMLTQYNSSSSSTANAAVAKLMYACGVSVQMDYSPVESGAISDLIAPALYTYFNYGESVQMPQRAYYTESQWEELIYNQLAQNLPVLYGGQSTAGGHQFICDGYDGDGYFHFNWGWSGMSDGYYLLSALDPEAQGTGGSTSGFNFDQGVCINIAKPGQLSAPSTLIYCAGNFMTEQLMENEEEGEASQTVGLGQTITFAPYGGLQNYGAQTVTGSFGVKLTDSDGNSQYVYGSSQEVPCIGSLENTNSSGASSFSVEIPTTLEAGTYTMTPVFLAQNASDPVDMLCPLSGVQSLNVTVSGSSAVITTGNAPAVTVTSAGFQSEVYLDSYFSLDFTVDNAGTEQYYGQIMALLVQDGEEVTYTEEMAPVSVNAGESASFNLIGMFNSDMSETEIEPGTYDVYLVDYSTGNILSTKQSLTVDVHSALTSEPILTLSSFELDGSQNVTDPSSMTFKGTVECESGYFAGQLNLVIFPGSGGDDIYSSYTDYIFIGEGQSYDFSLTVNLGSVVTDDSSYFAMIYNGSDPVADTQVKFNVTTGIADINADADAPAEYYDLQGVRVANPSHGHVYIERRGDVARKILF